MKTLIWKILAVTFFAHILIFNSASQAATVRIKTTANLDETRSYRHVGDANKFKPVTVASVGKWKCSFNYYPAGFGAESSYVLRCDSAKDWVSIEANCNDQKENKIDKQLSLGAGKEQLLYILSCSDI